MILFASSRFDPLARLLLTAEGDDNKGGGGGDNKGGGAAEPWYAAKDYGFDQDTQTFFAGKNYPDVKTALASLPHADKTARDRNVLPMPDADPAKRGEWEGWEKLGWVKDLTKYTPKKPEVKSKDVIFPEAVFESFRKAAHDARVPAAVTEALFGNLWTTMQGMIDAADARGAKSTEEMNTALDGKWGSDTAAKRDRASRAMKWAGATPEQIKAMGGDAGVVEMFEKIGAQLGEDTLKGGGGGGGALNPLQARAERLRLQADPAWMKIFNDNRHDQHKDYVARRQQLLDIEAQAERAA